MIGATSCVESTPLTNLSRTTKNVNVHRFEETIGGRTYQIDVMPVGNRWRAHLRRIHGGGALMPFYGDSPEEAAHLLAGWLEIAHRRLASSPPTVSTV